MRLDQLKEKALTLPLSPGVYIMKNKDGKVIYVGKAKHLKNRVSQYFQESAGHSVKTRMMVANIDCFDVIIAASEFEALVLECSLIKQYQPKYNILLKDGKGYPFIRLDMRQQYPTLSMVGKIENDGAEYFGPYGSRGVTTGIIQAIRGAFKLPDCSKHFPRDVGKDRPCLNYHMGNCAGWCQRKEDLQTYRETMEQVRKLLQGNYKSVAYSVETEMLAAADALNFELAASLRNRLSAIQSLGKKQLVTAGKIADMDVVGYAQTEAKACFVVLHYCGGALLDKDYEILPIPESREEAVSALLKQFYILRGFAPKNILLPFDVDDRELFETFLFQSYNQKTRIRVPQRGENMRYIQLAQSNAAEEAERATDKEEKLNATLLLFGKTIGLPFPQRIESFDISNLSGTDIVGSMVVYQNGKPKRSEYKRFKIKDMEDQNDYASMQQVLQRRFQHYINGDKGFDALPDLLLIDGGIAHAKVANEVLSTMDLSIPLYGMVKDDRHRTRALVDIDGNEIRIDNKPAVFAFVGTIQEETHRFAITFNRKLRSKRIRKSELDDIPGIGPTRKQALFRKFKSVKGIKQADVAALEEILPTGVANVVYCYFREKRGD